MSEAMASDADAIKNVLTISSISFVVANSRATRMFRNGMKKPDGFSATGLDAIVTERGGDAGYSSR
jgi:hypothetical protein